MAKTEVGLIADGAAESGPPTLVHDSFMTIIAQNGGERHVA
jgi:hypothetical protein